MLAGKMDGFYLAGGTALSHYHFQHHRESYDLDFFTQKYDPAKVDRVAAYLADRTSKEMNVVAREEDKKKFADIRRYDLVMDTENALRIDFVKDVHNLLEPLKEVNGIPVLSVADIYLRKIYAVTGVTVKPDATGRTVTEGGRQTASTVLHLILRVNGIVPHTPKFECHAVLGTFLIFIIFPCACNRFLLSRRGIATTCRSKDCATGSGPSTA